MATTGNISLPIGNVGETTGFTQGIAPSSSDGSAGDKDMFLKLLVAQMKYQDPSKPADSTQMLSQMAQFTMVEKMDALENAFTSELQATELTSATSLLGNTISYTKDDASKTGVVTGVSIVNGTPTLLVGSTEVALSAVTKVTPGTTTPATTTPTTTTPTTASTTGSGTTPAVAAAAYSAAALPAAGGMYSTPATTDHSDEDPGSTSYA